MKRASYRAGIRWIAEYDEPEDMSEESAAYYISSVLLADLFGVESERIGRDVIRARRKMKS